MRTLISYILVSLPILFLNAQNMPPCSALMDINPGSSELSVIRSLPQVLVVRGQYTYSLAIMHNENGWLAQVFSRQGQKLNSGDELIFVDDTGDRRGFFFVGQSRITTEKGLSVYSNLLDLNEEGLHWLAEINLRTILLRNNQKHEMRNFAINESRATELRYLIRCMLDMLNPNPPSVEQGLGETADMVDTEADLNARLAELELRVKDAETRTKTILDSLDNSVLEARERSDQLKLRYAQELQSEQLKAEKAIDSLRLATANKMKIQEDRAALKREALFEEMVAAHKVADNAIAQARQHAANSIQEINAAARSSQDSLELRLQQTQSFYNQEVERVRQRAAGQIATIRAETDKQLSEGSAVNNSTELGRMREEAVREQERIDLELAEARRSFEAEKARLAEQHTLSMANLREDMVREEEALQLDIENIRRQSADSIAEIRQSALETRRKMEAELAQAQQETNEALLNSQLGTRKAREELQGVQEASAARLQAILLEEEQQIAEARQHARQVRDSLEIALAEVEENTAKAIAEATSTSQNAREETRMQEAAIKADTEETIRKARQDAEEILAAIATEHRERVANAKLAADKAEEKYREEVTLAAERAAQRITRIRKNTEAALAGMQEEEVKASLTRSLQSGEDEIRRFEQEEKDLAASRLEATRHLAEEREANEQTLEDLREQGALQEQNLRESMARQRQNAYAAWMKEEADLLDRRDSTRQAFAKEKADLDRELLLERDRSARLILETQEEAYAEVDALMIERATALRQVRLEWENLRDSLNLQMADFHRESEQKFAAARAARQDSLSRWERQLSKELNVLEVEKQRREQAMEMEMEKLRANHEKEVSAAREQGLAELKKVQEDINRQLALERARLDSLLLEIKKAQETLDKSQKQDPEKKVPDKEN